MARPKIKINLPEWYNLEKYAETKTNDSACFWYEQLFIRKNIITLLTIQDPPTNIRSCVIDFLEVIRKNPIVDIDNTPQLKDFFKYSELTKIKMGSQNPSFGIHALTVRNLYNLETRIPKEKRIIARNHFDECSDNAGKGFYTQQHKAETWFNDPLNSTAKIFPHEACIRINFELTDKILTEQFKKNLPMLRKQHGISPETGKSRRPISTDDLYKYSILPYLDLEMWSYENNIHMTNAIIADAIFESGTRSEDDIKISKKIAHQLTREANLSCLAAQAALEKTNK